MQRLVWNELSQSERAAALARPVKRRETAVAEIVRTIFDDVEREGEAAVARWALKLDKRAPEALTLTGAAVDAARAKLAPEDLAALDTAVANVAAFHTATLPQESEIETSPGVRCKRVWRPIASCGLYIPAGTAPLFSTLIMLAEPARAAGVPQRIVTTPAREAPHPMMIAAAAACGVDTLWLVGGAQAIAALTFGAELPKAEKIFGPGNAYVAEAKRYAAGLPSGPQIDVPAGPSELMVIADAEADPALIAADLLSQAEHDRDAQVILAVTDARLLDAVAIALEAQLATLPRAAIARAAMDQARLILARNAEEAAAIANAYAPEHLALHVADTEPLLAEIDNAGAIFVGRWSAETFGDYVCGPSHVLPTDGAARAWSGVSTGSFMRSFTVQTLSEAGARTLAPAAARLARLEGLEAHARAADLRAL
ncbi:MAG TPA: histidinol dehydrogenase [Terricaulis sp.]|nr:histidinol dehydrogenase [Terricaulis sp.]